MNSILKIILLIGCLLQTTSAQAGFLLVFSTSGDSEEAITEITGDVGQTFTVTVFVREEGGNILNTYGLFGFGITGSYQASALSPLDFQDTSTPIRLTSTWTVDTVNSAPQTFSNGNFLLWGQASNPYVAVNSGSNVLELGEFQFTIAQARTIDFSFLTNDSTFDWFYEDHDGTLQKPEFEDDQVNLKITGVPEPGALGLMMIVSWAVLSVQRKRRP